MKNKILALLLAALMVVSLLPMTALAGTISTVSDVLNTVTDGFPTYQGDIPENAWTTDSGNMAFIYNGHITFYLPGYIYYGANLDDSVSEESGNYVYTGGTLTLTFNMQDGVLVSINLYDTFSDNAKFNGLYTSPTASAAATPVTSVNVNWTSPAAGTTVNELLASLTDYLTYTDSANKGTIVYDKCEVVNDEYVTLAGTDAFESGEMYAITLTYTLPEGYYYNNEVKYDTANSEYYFNHTGKLTITLTGFDDIAAQGLGKAGESVTYRSKTELNNTEANVVEITGVFTIGAAATHDLSVTKSGGATEGVDYAWDDTVLNILTNGLTVSGNTTTETIVIPESATVTDLTLKGLTINIDGELALYADDSAEPLTLHLESGAVIDLKAKNDTIIVGRPLTVDGTGSMTVETTNSIPVGSGCFALLVDGDFTLNGGTVNLTAGDNIFTGTGDSVDYVSYGLLCGGDVTLAGGSLTAKGGQVCASATSFGFTVDGAGALTVTGGHHTLAGYTSATPVVPDAKVVKASTNYDGSADTPYVAANIATYKYLELEAAGAAASATYHDVGKGTSDEPWEISTLAQLNDLAAAVNGTGAYDGKADNMTGKFFKLTADIGTTEKPFTTPIGTGDYPFSGNFDGDGHTVTLGINGDFAYAGLFGNVYEVVIKNVTTGGIVSGKPADLSVYYGGICGYFNSGMILNCHNTADICYQVGEGFTTFYLGGICGINCDGTILNCSNSGDFGGAAFNEDEGYVGGVCGWSDSGVIKNCYSIGRIDVTEYDVLYCGGVCGENAGEIINCYSSESLPTPGICDHFGGVCGTNEDSVFACYYDKSIYTEEDATDGVTGLVTAQMQTMSGSTYGEADAVLDGTALVDLLNGYEDPDTSTYPTGWLEWTVKSGKYPTFKVETPAHTHDGVTFEPWDSDNSLPAEGGNWYLTKDVTLTQTWKAPASTTNLCLNGHVIRQTTGDYGVMEGRTGHILNIYDCNQATSHEGYLDENGLWHLSTDTTLGTPTTITGGIITGGSAGGIGGGFLYTNGGIVTLYGGTICGNSSYSGLGGAVSTSSGSFAMYGGAIRYNRARNGAGGIYTFNNGKLILGGNALICDNTSEYFGKDDVRSANSGTITLASGTNGPKAGMRVGLAGDLIRVYGATKAADADYFFCDDNTKTLGYNSAEGCLEYVMDPVSYVVRDVEGNETPATCTNYVVVDSSIESFSPDLWYVVNTDTTINGDIYGRSGTVNLILCDGCTLKVNKGIHVYSDVTLNIYGQSGDTGKLIATGANGAAGIGSSDALTDNGTVNIHGGIIQAIGSSMAHVTGAGIGGCKEDFETSGGGTVNIYGGTVTAEGKDGSAGIGGGAGGAAANVTIGKRLAVMNITSGEPGTKVTMSGTWGATLNGIQKVRVELDNSHAHDFTYSATDNVLTATCKATDCDLHATPTTLTLTTPTNLVYDNTAKELTFATGEADAWTAAGCATPGDIVYYLEDGTEKTTTANSGAEGEGKAPVNAGTYVAKVTVDTDKTAVLEFTVAKKAIDKCNQLATWYATKDYASGDKQIPVAFTVPDGMYFFGTNCGFIGDASAYNTFARAALDKLSYDGGTKIYTVGNFEASSDQPGAYKLAITWELPDDYKTNYYIDLEIDGTIMGTQTAPGKGEGYSIAPDFKITVESGYEVNDAEGFTGTTIATGDTLVENNTYYIRKAKLEYYHESPATAFVAEVNNCEYTETVSLTEGTFGMKLGGKDMGWFKFEAVDGGWKIMKTAKPGLLGTILNPYLAVKDGKLTYTDSDNATIWTYKNGAFYTSVKTTKEVTTSYGILGWLFGFGGKTTKKDVTTTYYLSTVTDGQKLSTNTVKAELYTEASGAHEYGNWIDCKDGANHKRMCKHCGEWETEAHSYDPDTHKCVCGAYDPSVADVKISVDVTEKTTKQFSGFLFWGTWKDVTTYTATIKTEATGVKVTKVQYQLGGGRWTTGTKVSSNKPIESLKVKAWDSNGKLYEYTYTKSN